MLEAGGLKAERDFFLAFSPERVDPGNAQFTTRNIPKVVGGSVRRAPKRRPRSTASVVATVVPVSSTRVAEMVKLLENTFRAVNIGLVNEIALMCHKMDINVWEVIDAAKTKPFGFMPFYPGPGPRRALHPDRPVLPVVESAAERVRVPVHRAGRAGQRVDAATTSCERVADALNTVRKPINGSRDPSVRRRVQEGRRRHARIAGARYSELLVRRGAAVSYTDPYVPTLDAPVVSTFSGFPFDLGALLSVVDCA